MDKGDKKESHIQNKYEAGWHYYVQDYMGNNRMVVNLDGTVEQETHYYPYGGVIGDLSSNESLQPYKFEGKVLAAIEKIDNLRREDEPLGEGIDRTFGLDWYDIQARQYDAIGIPGWNAVDPLAEKYYSISPYVYCAGNPVNLVDYDGEKIIFDENVSIKFIKDFCISYLVLLVNGAGDNISNAIMSRDYTITIKEGDTNSFNPNDNSITWSNNHALYTYNDYILTPMETLSHEFDHAVYYQNASDEQRAEMKDEDPNYGTKDEKRVITGSEQKTARKLGKLKEGERTREDHGGSTFLVNSPLSEEPLNIITNE